MYEAWQQFTSQAHIIALTVVQLQQNDAARKINGMFDFIKPNMDFETELNQLKIESAYLIFGLFSSDNYSSYNIFKVTKEKLFIDSSGTWHSQRHTRQGYLFKGEEMSGDKFEIAKELLYEIPLDLLRQIWKGFNATGNKNEDLLILEFETSEFHRTISIDSYEIETEELPLAVRNYRLKIENIVKRLID